MGRALCVNPPPLYDFFGMREPAARIAGIVTGLIEYPFHGRKKTESEVVMHSVLGVVVDNIPFVVRAVLYAGLLGCRHSVMSLVVN